MFSAHRSRHFRLVMQGTRSLITMIVAAISASIVVRFHISLEADYIASCCYFRTVLFCHPIELLSPVLEYLSLARSVNYRRHASLVSLDLLLTCDVATICTGNRILTFVLPDRCRFDCLKCWRQRRRWSFLRLFKLFQHPGGLPLEVLFIGRTLIPSRSWDIGDWAALTHRSTSWLGNCREWCCCRSCVTSELRFCLWSDEATCNISVKPWLRRDLAQSTLKQHTFLLSEIGAWSRVLVALLKLLWLWKARYRCLNLGPHFFGGSFPGLWIKLSLSACNDCCVLPITWFALIVFVKLLNNLGRLILLLI